MTRDIKDIITDMREIVRPYVAQMLFNENFEGKGNTDKAEFETEFEMLLTLAERGATVEAVPLSVIEKIKAEIHKEITSGGKWSGGWYEKSEEQAEKDFTKRINAITPVTREHGEWLNVANGIEYDWATCSICGGRTMMARRYYPFCPNCGADMRGEKE